MKFLTLTVTFKISGKWTTKTDVIPVALKCMSSKDIDIKSESVQVFIDFVIK